MITYTDHYQAIKDQVKSLITAEFSRFKRHNALIERNSPESSDFGREEVLRISYGSVISGRQTTDTVINEYPIILTYYRQIPTLQQDTVSDVVERLQQVFLQNRSSNDWHFLRLTTDHNPGYEAGREPDTGELTDAGEPLPNLVKIEIELTIFAQVTING